MKIKNYVCKKCGHDEFFLRPSESYYGINAIRCVQFGIHCFYCGRWFKWADKGERLLFEKEANNEDN